jgi:hypothetical protein
LRSPEDRKAEVFIHVPVSADEDASIALKKLNDFEYSLDPFPFSADRLKLTCGGWYFHRYPEDQDPAKLGDALKALPRDAQIVTLVAG